MENQPGRLPARRAWPGLPAACKTSNVPKPPLFYSAFNFPLGLCYTGPVFRKLQRPGFSGKEDAAWL
jgi:hypothetical protein